MGGNRTQSERDQAGRGHRAAGDTAGVSGGVPRTERRTSRAGGGLCRCLVAAGFYGVPAAHKCRSPAGSGVNKALRIAAHNVNGLMCCLVRLFSMTGAIRKRPLPRFWTMPGYGLRGIQGRQNLRFRLQAEMGI